MHVAMALNVTLWSRIFRKPALPSSVTFTRVGSADGSRLTGSIVPSKGRYGAAIWALALTTILPRPTASFTLHDDKHGGNNVTFAYGSRTEAESARRLMLRAIARTRSATVPEPRPCACRHCRAI